eukprot:8640197-Pyramimonas_sp.AAC.1
MRRMRKRRRRRRRRRRIRKRREWEGARRKSAASRGSGAQQCCEQGPRGQRAVRRSCSQGRALQQRLLHGRLFAVASRVDQA